MGISPKKELRRFLSEDIGKGDITSDLLPATKKISAKIITKQNCIVAGVNYAKEIFFLKGCRVKIIKKDGSKVKARQTILIVSGSPQSVLSCERTALNLLSRMSGIATKTNMLIKKIRAVNPKIKLYATRKTAPGLRLFDKEAVRIGGGHRHRMSLEDMVIIKDNHLMVGVLLSDLIQKAKRKYKKIEVEVDNEKDAIVAAKEGATIIMLDNSTPQRISKTIARLSEAGLRKKVKLEASGGINAKNIQTFAKTKVDSISVGEITNSVEGIDLSLEII